MHQVNQTNQERYSASHPLYQMKIGEQACVCALPSKDGMRRRLMELGLIAGTKVTCLHRSLSGDPTAYMIRGTVIALRKKDAAQIQVIPL